MGRLIWKIMRQPVPKKSKASIRNPARIGPPTEAGAARQVRTAARLAHLGRREHLAQHAEPLGQHDGGEQAPEGPRGDEHLGRDGEAAQQRARGEADGADEEYPAAAEDVTEPASGE